MPLQPRLPRRLLPQLLQHHYIAHSLDPLPIPPQPIPRHIQPRQTNIPHAPRPTDMEPRRGTRVPEETD
jgi:hypothetical protein